MQALGIQMLSTLQEYKDKKSLVSIEREDIDTNGIQGFILDFSNSLLLLQYVYDFNLDGLLILRVEDITNINCTKTDIFQLELLKQEKLFKKINFHRNYDLSNFKTTISALNKEFSYFILEDEKPDDPVFLIGTINKLTSRSVHLNYFTGAGNWDKKPSIINYKDITACQVDTNYINVYKRYFQKTS